MPASVAVPVIVIGMLGGHCPVQAEGTINGLPFYFRARGDCWRMNIGGADVVASPLWSYEETYGAWPDAGWITEDDARRFIERSAKMFSEGRPGTGYNLFGELP